MATPLSDQPEVSLDDLLNVVTVAVNLREQADWLTVWACATARRMKATNEAAYQLRASKRWVQILARVGYEFTQYLPSLKQIMNYATQAGALWLWASENGEEQMYPDFESGLSTEHFRQAVKAETQSPIYWIGRAAAKHWSARELAMAIAEDDGKEAAIPYLTRHKCHATIDDNKIVLTPLGEWAPSGDDPETLRVTAVEVK